MKKVIITLLSIIGVSSIVLGILNKDKISGFLSSKVKE